MKSEIEGLFQFKPRNNVEYRQYLEINLLEIFIVNSNFQFVVFEPSGEFDCCD